MAADRSDDADLPSGSHSDHSADRANTPADDGRQPARPPAETRSRGEAYDSLRAITESVERSESAGRSEPGARSKPAQPTDNGPQPPPGTTWEEKTDLYRWIWAEYKNKWPDKESPEVDTPEDLPGTWRGEGGRVLDRSMNERIEAECDRVVDRDDKVITPAMRAIESQDPHRHLVGYEHHLKGRDRIKEKVYGTITDFHRSPEQAVSLVPDTLRFTFQYDDARYTQGVYADTARLQEQGFRLYVRKNFWSEDQYKGINSQWVEPVSGQRIEVQFHTYISYEAKQITHPAYERLRALPKPDAFEQMVLEAFQEKVTAEVPVPPGAADIPEYPERGRDAR